MTKVSLTLTELNVRSKHFGLLRDDNNTTRNAWKPYFSFVFLAYVSGKHAYQPECGSLFW